MRVKSKPERISRAVESLLSSTGYLSICRNYEAMNKWGEIVGPEVGAVSSCTRVEKGTMYVRVKSAPWRQELSYMKDEVLSMIKKHVPKSTIKGIVFY
jgi:hypothetical protein